MKRSLLIDEPRINWWAVTALGLTGCIGTILILWALFMLFDTLLGG